jgi:hypothetical protein
MTAISSVSGQSSTSLENTNTDLGDIQKNSAKEESMFFMFGFQGTDTDYYDTEDDGSSSMASETSKGVAIEESTGAATQSSTAVSSNNVNVNIKSVAVPVPASSGRTKEESASVAVPVPSSDAVAKSKHEMKQDEPVSVSKSATATAETAATAAVSHKKEKKHRRRKKERPTRVVSVVSCRSERYYNASEGATNSQKKRILPKHTPNALKDFIELATGWKDAHAKMKIKLQRPPPVVIRSNTKQNEKTKGEQRRYNAMTLFEFMSHLNFLLKLVWEIMSSRRTTRAAFKADASFKPFRIVIKSCTKLLQKFVECNVDEQRLSFRLVMPHHDRDVRKIQSWNAKLHSAVTLVLYDMPDAEHGFIAAEQMRALGLVKSATAKTKTNNNEKDNDITTDEDYTDVDSDRENAKAAVSVTPKYSVASKSESKQPPTESRNKCMTMISRLWLDHQKKDTAV